MGYQQANIDDSVLVRSILDGQTGLFRLLAERYAERLMRMVSRMVPSKEDAEEVTQDALVEAYKSLARFDNKQSSFQTWLYRIAYHTALKHYRQSQKSVQIVDAKQEWLDNISDEETNEILSDTSSDRLSLLEKAIDLLKPDDQMLLSFFYFDGLSVKEISDITGKDGGYLRSRMQWIRKRIAKIIQYFNSKSGVQN